MSEKRQSEIVERIKEVLKEQIACQEDDGNVHIEGHLDLNPLANAVIKTMLIAIDDWAFLSQEPSP